MVDFLVVGGGIIGLLITRKLAQAGVSVLLVDKQKLAQESSWAGGGILAPMYPWRYPDALNELVDWNAENFKQLAGALIEETGIDPEVRLGGVNMLDVSDDAAAMRWATQGVGANSGLYRREVGDFLGSEPLLRGSESTHSVLTLPMVGNVRNPRLLKALIKSLRQQKNVQILEYCALKGFVRKGAHVTGIETAQGPISAKECIVAAGAWSGDLLKCLEVPVSVSPVKGQMLLIKAKPGLLASVVLAQGCYLIPRQDGRILVGSTIEHQGYDKTTTHEARDSLLNAAYRIAPSLKDYPVEKHWAGLRPSSPESIPYIGRLEGFKGISVCAGHFRNGVVTAPRSADILVNQLLGV